MNNILYGLKKFFKNKNTVTIIGVVLILVILYVFYNAQIKKQTNPIKVPVAAQTIQPRTKITSEMVELIDVSPIMLQGNVIKASAYIVGKYTNYNTLIPKGSMFYSATVVDEADLPDSAFTKVDAGQVPYNFPVNLNTTYGNSIYPDNYIDIYMKAVDDTGTLMVGKLLENVKVLAVKDSQGRNVFESTAEARTPSTLIFGVTPEVHILLRKASYMSNFSVVLFPVPHGGEAEVSGATQVSSQYLKEFINAHTVANDELLNSTDDTVVENTTVGE